MKNTALLCTGFAAAALLTACGGGRGTTGVVPTPAPTTSTTPAPPTLNASVQFSFTVPPAPKNTVLGRHANVSTPAGAQSVSIGLQSVNGAAPPATQTPTVANFSASTPGCTAAPDGTLTCSVTLTSYAGADVFTVVTYSQPNASGTNLGTGSVSVTGQANQTTTAPATLTGNVASITITPGVAFVGSAVTVPVAIIAKDSSGNAIIGSFSSPITLTDTDASGQTSLSTTTLADTTAAAGVTMSYKGGSMTAPATISATMSGLAASAVTNGSFSPNTSAPLTNGSTFTRTRVTYGTVTFFSTATPRPLPTSTATITDTVTTGLTYNNVPNAVNYFISNNNNGVVSTSNNYYLPVAGQTMAAYAYLGATYNVPVGSTGTFNYASTCTTPYGVMTLAPLPTSYDEVTGTGPCTFTQTTNVPNNYADTLSGVQNSDGSYTSTDTFTIPNYPTNNTVTNYAINADGTGTVTANSPGGSSIIQIATPAPNASTMPLLVQYFPGAIPSPGATGTPTPVATTEPNIYAVAGFTNGQPAGQMDSDKMVNKGTTTLPTDCAIPSSVLGNATITELDETFSFADPTFYADQGTARHFYANGIGEVCIISSYTESLLFLGGSLGNMQLINRHNTVYLTVDNIVAAAKRAQSVSNALQGAAQALTLGSAAERRQMLAEILTSRHRH